MIRTLPFAVGLLAALSALPLAAAPLPNTKANYEPPTATFQMATGQKVLLDLAGYCANVFDKKTNGELLAKAKDLTGDKMLAGLDLNRPAGAYLYLRPKVQDSEFVFVLPITNEKAALESLAAIGFEVAREDKARGLVTFQELKLQPWHAFSFLNGVAPVLRFHDQSAYIALHNGNSDVLNKPEKLVPLPDLVNAKETAHLAGTFHFDRFPKELQKPLFDLLNEGLEGVAQMQQRGQQGLPKGFPACAQQVLIWCQRNLGAMFADAETLGAKFTLDAKAGDHDFEAILAPKAKTPLAADIAGFQKAKGRFAQLLTNEAVAGISMALPVPIPAEICTTAGAFLGDWINLEFGRGFAGLGIDGPLAEMVNKQIAAGQADVAGAVFGPDTDGQYTALAAVGIADAAGTEKALRAAFKDAPKEIAERIQYGAVKIGDTKAHTVAIMDSMPEVIQKAFGEKNKLLAAFTQDAAYLAIGPDAAVRIEKAMALKPARAVVFNTVIHKEKFKPFATMMSGREFPLPLAAKNELVPIYRADAFGGDGLHVKMHLGMMLFGAGVHGSK